MKNKKGYSRRDFIQNGMRLSLILALGGVSGVAVRKKKSKEWVWQIDPFLCNQCGRCATDCVKNPSAVKCIDVFDICGYCDLCGGYYIPDPISLDTAAENQLCPTAALKRRFIEEPYFEYTIEEDLCIGCAKCVKACASFGNGSLHLQINQDLCQNCNQCSIARVCPSKAIIRIPATDPYLLKKGFTKS